MANALDVAYYFLSVAPKEDELTNLKIQKLCSYAQAVSLAYSGRELFEDEIYALHHGPVVPSVYDRLKTYGHAQIPSPISTEKALAPFSKEEQYVLQMTWAIYGRLTAWALREQSHWDFPGNFKSQKVIKKEDIKKAFNTIPIVKHMRMGKKPEDVIHLLKI